MSCSRSAASIAGFAILAAVCCASAFAVYRGQAVTIQATPWTVLVMEPQQLDCTGVIIDPLHVLTAGHCIVTGNADSTMPPTAFTVEAGVSNYKHPLPFDVRQVRTVSAVHLMPGYSEKDDGFYAIAHDIAVLTLSRPLDLSGPDARAVNLPAPDASEPSARTKVVMAGFGEEILDQTPTGALNEIANPTMSSLCKGTGDLCVRAPVSAACPGDSGSGLVELGSHPTLIGIMSESICNDGFGLFAPLDSPAALRFIKATR